MQSNNPVFRRSEEFNRANTYGNPTYQGNGSAYQNYGTPQAQYQGYEQSPQGYGDPVAHGAPPVQGERRMTIDSVVQTTAITLGVVLIAAFATWVLTPDIETATTGDDLAPLYLAMMVGTGGAFILSLVNSFKRVVSPPLVLAFAVLEGVALGALSKFFDSLFSTPDSGSIVVQAVLGTMAAFGGTLAAYKFFNIQVNNKFRTFVIAAMFGMVALSLMEFALGFFGASLGLFGFGTLGLITAIVGLVLGVFMLILDFDFVEQGVRNGIPQQESWRAAFAMTVSLVWIYTNLLRLLAILNQD